MSKRYKKLWQLEELTHKDTQQFELLRDRQMKRWRQTAPLKVSTGLRECHKELEDMTCPP